VVDGSGTVDDSAVMAPDSAVKGTFVPPLSAKLVLGKAAKSISAISPFNAPGLIEKDTTPNP